MLTNSSVFICFGRRVGGHGNVLTGERGLSWQLMETVD